MNATDYDGSHPLYALAEMCSPLTKERIIQRLTIKRARYLGWKVTWFSRGHSTQRDPGWPDLSMWRTYYYMGEQHWPTKQVLFIELKAHRGVVRTDQQDCHEHLGQFAPTFAIKIPRDMLLLDYILEHGGDDGYATADNDDAAQERQA